MYTRSLHGTYRLLRGITLVGGGFWVLASVSAFIAPRLAYEDGPVPSLLGLLLRLAGSLLLAAAIALPLRWTTSGLLFIVRLFLFGAIALWIAYMGIQGVFDYFDGGKHWMIIPTSLYFLIFALALPLSLLIRRKAVSRPDGV